MCQQKTSYLLTYLLNYSHNKGYTQSTVNKGIIQTERFIGLARIHLKNTVKLCGERSVKTFKITKLLDMYA